MQSRLTYTGEIVHVPELMSADYADQLLELFNHLLQTPDSKTVLQFVDQQGEVITNLNAQRMRDESYRWRFITMKHHHITVSAFFQAMQQNHLAFNYERYSDILTIRSKAIDFEAHDYENILKEILSIYHHYQSENLLIANVRNILRELLLFGSFELLAASITHDLMQRLLQVCDAKTYLHYSFKYSVHARTPRLLLQLLDIEPHQFLDNDGNHLLHVCKHPENFSLCQTFVTNINHGNRLQETALHIAVLDGDLEKFRYLLLNGADVTATNYAGKTPLNILDNKSMNPLREYLAAMSDSNGVTLSIPPPANAQYGYTCGFVAIDTANQHLRLTQHRLFNTEYIPGRKCDQKDHSKRNVSLRQFAKDRGLTQVGELFYSDSLRQIIAYAGCESRLYEPKNYSDFMAHIRACLQQDLPVIIPYGHGGVAGANAHWAVVIGAYTQAITKDPLLLLANHGDYEAVKASIIYDCFADLEDTHPPCFLYKNKGEDWNKTLFESTEKYDHLIKLDCYDLTQDFKGKLICVSPPDADAEVAQRTFTM